MRCCSIQITGIQMHPVREEAEPNIKLGKDYTWRKDHDASDFELASNLVTL